MNSAYNKYVKPYICVFAMTAAGVYLLNPRVIPMIPNVPIIMASDAAKGAVLAGFYGALSFTACDKLGIARFL